MLQRRLVVAASQYQASASLVSNVASLVPNILAISDHLRQYLALLAAGDGFPLLGK